MVLIAFGIGAVVLSIHGKNTVQDSLEAEQIVGSPDMTPDEIQKEASAAGLKNVDVPSCDVAGENIDTGSEAKCFAEYMRIHALEASGGLSIDVAHDVAAVRELHAGEVREHALALALHEAGGVAVVQQGHRDLGDRDRSRRH